MKRIMVMMLSSILVLTAASPNNAFGAETVSESSIVTVEESSEKADPAELNDTSIEETEENVSDDKAVTVSIPSLNANAEELVSENRTLEVVSENNSADESLKGSVGSDDTVPTTIDNETDEILSENEMKLASSFDTADTISVNTSYSGSLVNYDSVNYYKFTLSRPGYVSFSFSHDFVDSGNEYWDLNLYSSDDLNNELLSRSYIGNELNSINSYGTGLPTGTYYIKINHHSWNWSDVKYTFTVKYVDSDYYEKEKNDGVDTSSNIALNQNYSGNLMTNGDVDWYKFSLSKAGYVSFKFSHDFVDSSNNYYELHLFSSDDLNNELLDRAYIGNELYEVNSYGSGLPAGTYYIKINHYYWNWSDVKYTFSVNCDYSDYYETETNNSSSSADMVKLNSIYTGNLMVYSDSDYYMFSLVKDGYVSITFSHDYVDHDATYWELHLYNSTNLNDKITSYSYVGNDRNQTTTQPVSLSAGTLSSGGL